MAPQRYVLAVGFFLLVGMASSSFISDAVFQSHGSTGRSLLQSKKMGNRNFSCRLSAGCQINFEFQNYTIITSRCRGPHYPPSLCCQSLKDFACPFAPELNDVSTDCASTMFSYINLYGKYPPGLFSSECQEGKLGLACPAISPETAASDLADKNGGQAAQKLSPLLILGTAFSLLFLSL